MGSLTEDYISSLTGAEIDAAVLLILQKFVSTFNGRRGFNITPEKGDYSADKITTTDINIPESLESEDFGDSVSTMLSKILEKISRPPQIKLLWGGRTWVAGQNIVLSESFLNFREISFVYSNTGEGFGNISSSYIDCKNYPVPFLKDCLEGGDGAIALFGYSNRFIKFSVTSQTTFTWIRNGDSGSTGIIAVYGIE